MPAKLTIEIFIKRASELHNNKYDYSNSIYLTSNHKIDIICPIHGIFAQRTLDHLKGSGCSFCSGNNKKTHDQFLIEANKTHNNKYIYPEKYAGSSTIINIECYIHGIFKQSAYNHLMGQGCPKCANINNGLNKRKSNKLFLEEANKIHNNKYIYIGEYVGTDIKIEIICPVHGSFRQAPHLHLNGRGCRKCADDQRAINYKKDINLFIDQANVAHNHKYDYSEVIYVNTHVKVKIICPDHGIFLQAPMHHIHEHGCPKCCLGTNFSKAELAWLDYLNIPLENRQIILKIGKTRVKTDAYDPITNTIYEFNGDFWHGNPEIYDPNDINVVSKKTFGDLYAATMAREVLIKSAGYNLVSIWETDWNKLLNEQAKLS